MELLRNLIEQARTLWAAASNPGRFAFVATLVVCITTIVGVGYWSSRPQYIAMASELAPSESAEIISKLAAEKIPYETNISGSTVYVPKHELSRARSAAGTLIEGSSSESADAGFLIDPAELPDRLLRRKERSLERTISQMPAFSSADVYIAQPQWTPFAREQQATTASVVLGIRSRSNFREQQAAGIAALVAGSVEGLETDGVTITDLNGNILWGESSPHGNDIARQLEFQQQLETRKSAEAEAMLRTLLGPGKALVKVSADLNFTRRETVKTTYDPEEKVKISEKIGTTSTTSSPKTPLGAAGTSSNLTATATASQTSTETVNKTEDILAEYQASKTEESATEIPGSVKRLTVAVTVDLPAADPSQPAAGGTAITKERIESLVKQAIGFDERRGDKIEVLVSSLPGAVSIAEPAPLQDMEFYMELVRNGSLGIAALLAFVLGLLVLRKIRPISLPSVSQPFDAGRARMIAELSRQVGDNPETASKIMAAWLNQTDQEANSEEAGASPASGDAGRRRAA